MKRLIWLLLLTGMVVSLSGKEKGKFKERDISGRYYNESGDILEISGNRLTLKEPDSKYDVVVTGAFWADCSFEWIDDQFIELNSACPLEKGYKNSEIRQFSDPDVSPDSVKISFILPYEGTLEISAYGFNPNRDSESNNSDRSVMLPKGKGSISATIGPESFSLAHNLYGAFYGVTFFAPFPYDYRIEEGNNHVEVKLPNIDNSFFEMYYVKGEYARVWKDTITWKGIVYKKGK